MDLDVLYEKAIYRLVRLNKKYGKLGVYLSLLFNAIIRLFVSCDISVFCKLGKVKIPHAIGIVIGSTAVVEDGTVIMANVCIGSAFGDRRENNHKYAKIGKTASWEQMPALSVVLQSETTASSAQGLDLHQRENGPLFGEMTQEILNEVFLLEKKK